MVTISEKVDGEVVIRVTSRFCLHEVPDAIAEFVETRQVTAEKKAEKIAELAERIAMLEAKKDKWEAVVTE
jgi:flagellar motility protein MotE (MotC chaperone)